MERINQTVTLGVDLNILVGLPPDFEFQPEAESPAVASVHATPKPPVAFGLSETTLGYFFMGSDFLKFRSYVW